MTAPYKPRGYSSVSPYLLVAGAEKTIEFLRKVFDAEVLQRTAGEHSRLMHAEVRIDDTVLMLGDALPGIAMDISA